MPTIANNAVGFVVQNQPVGERVLADPAGLFEAYATLDPRIDPTKQAYMSAFVFPPAFQGYVKQHNGVGGYRGPCGSDFVWFDIDGPDLPSALSATKTLLMHATNDLDADEANTLVFFSGAKGFHIGLPLHWQPPMHELFPLHCRAFAEGIASSCGVKIDPGIYDHVRLFRAPNSWHAKSGLYKRNLPVDGFERLGMQAILEMAQEAVEFEVPEIGGVSCPKLEAVWNACTPGMQQMKLLAGYVSDNTNLQRLDRLTVDFVRDGAEEGERANRLFKAAANMSEYVSVHGAEALAYALLSEAALDSGLPRQEVDRTFANGWKRGDRSGRAA
jgi:hypothetical protein